MLNKELIEKNLKHVLAETNFANLGEKKKGKVRDVYVQKDKILLIASDRYSAFDRNLALIPFKGQVLTQVSKYWFEKTSDLAPNHILANPDANVLVVKKCEVLPIEMVIRGYITGVTGTSLWMAYQDGKRDFGDFVLPDGMHKNQKLPEPVITPTTKSDAHDQNLTSQEILEQGIVDRDLWEKIKETTYKLFERGQALARERGLILVDTKYEFGLDEKKKLTLIDEIHTPDSSRYWQAGNFEARIKQGQEPENFDKEFLRLWFKENCDPYHDEVLPPAPSEMVAELSHRYIKIYEQITGLTFQANIDEPIPARIEKNLAKYVV